MAGTKNPDRIEVIKVSSKEHLKQAQHIRYEVFVEGQNVPVDEEIDQYEDSSTHFLALQNGVPCGAARWRKTENGIKLERFAVLAESQGKGIGSALVQAVLEDIDSSRDLASNSKYLHAQLAAMPLYSKFGFEKVGELFLECDIEHYKMVK